MNLDRQLWHVRLYFWSVDVADAFLDRESGKYQSNLCQYIRTIFLVMPIALLVTVAFWSYAYYVLVYFPVTEFGVGSTLVAYISVVAVALVVCLLYVLKKRASENKAAHAWHPSLHKQPGLFAIIWVYIVSVKQKVCPTIRFQNINRTRRG